MKNLNTTTAAVNTTTMPQATYDLRRVSGRDAMHYVSHSATMFALMLKAGSRTDFNIVTAENLLNAIHTHRAAFKVESGILKWKAPQVDRDCVKGFPWEKNAHDLPIALHIPKPWKAFEKGANGTRSDAQEQAVCDALNRMNFKCLRWEVTAHGTPENGYVADVTGYDRLTGEKVMTIEVKGNDGMLGSAERILQMLEEQAGE